MKMERNVYEEMQYALLSEKYEEIHMGSYHVQVCET